MADQMNFGPEWLRNLSSEGSTTGAPKYQLAEFRYGREEMLALFDRTVKPPEQLKRIQGIYIEKLQIPMALIPMTEEESRAWNRGINSESSMRNGKVPAGPPGMVRGRGGSVERGRGRGRGFYYTRPGGFEDPDLLQKEIPTGERPFLRTSRSFDRTTVGERAWPDRNGEPADWNGSTSPRKEFSGAMRGGGMDNWRRNRGGGSGGGDDDDGWRQKDKWPRSSWREDVEMGAEPGKGGATGRSTNWGRGWMDEGVRGRDEGDPRRSHNMEDMPEWATADSHEPSGSFDASGAFHGSHSDEDEGQGEIDGRNRAESIRTRHFSEGPEGRKRDGDPGRKPAEPEIEPEPAKAGLARSKTAAELNPPQRNAANISKSASSAALSDAQSLDRIRAQHQNFVTKAEPEPPAHAQPPPPQEKVAMSPVAPLAAPNPLTSPQIQPQISPTSVKMTAEKRPLIENMLSQSEVVRQSSEDDMSRLAVDSVVRLIEEEDKMVKPLSGENCLWFYRDPNGQEQGPFPASEMQNWYRQGYFSGNLLVRREHEERYNALGELMRLNKGRVPFFPANPNLTAIPAPLPPIDPINFHLAGPMPQPVPKLPETDVWSSLTQSQREAILTQRLLISQQAQAPMPQVMNPVAQLITQLQQQATLANLPQPDASVPDAMRALLMMQPQPPPAHHLPRPVMPHLVPQAPVPRPMDTSVLADMKKEDMLQAMLRKMQTAKAAGQRPTLDSLWSGPGRPMNWPNGLATPQNTLWAMKKEDDILPEQQKQAQQRAAEEELRKAEEARKLREKKEEEERKEREALEEKKRQEEQRRLEEEEKLRVLLRLGPRPSGGPPTAAGTDPFQLQREKEKEENKKRLEEQRRKIEEMRKLEEAQKKKEERERRKEEEREKKRLAEEEEKKRQEAAASAAAAAAAEEKERLEQQRRQEEALRCLKQQQMKSRMKPWSQSTTTPASLAEIQAQEKEKKLQMQREQLVQMMAQAAEQPIREPEPAPSKANDLVLKWADQPASRVESVKSLAEIQAEQQVQLAKQQEKERQERALQQRDLPVNAGIWGSSNSGLNWTNHNAPTNNSNASAAPWAAVSPPPAPAGFWDDAYSTTKVKSKAPSSPTKSKPQPTAAAKKAPVTNAKAAKPKAKRDEAMVLKLFEQSDDEFTSWCTSTLCNIPTSIDVPTFTNFLRDIESPFDVKDYVKTYLGENREANEFARQFLERRSRWKSAKKIAIEEDDMCAPAPAVNPPGMEAQDVAKKGKKPKKGKMMKVDSRILGFNVTAAQNRINVGERETWDPNS